MQQYNDPISVARQGGFTIRSIEGLVQEPFKTYVFRGFGLGNRQEKVVKWGVKGGSECYCFFMT